MTNLRLLEDNAMKYGIVVDSGCDLTTLNQTLNQIDFTRVPLKLDIGYKGGKVIIAHCFAPELAKFLSNTLHELFLNCSIEIMPTSGLCSYYAEQGGILVGFET